MAHKAGHKRSLDFVDFLNNSPTPFHAVRTARSRLEKAGFVQIRERDSWHESLQPGGKYYLTRNASTIVAFAIGKSFKPGNAISMVAAHTDSPCLRLKPVSTRAADGFVQIGVETYGGGMWHSWFDRDLGVAGRVMVRGKDGAIAQKLVRINKPICRIPSLAVHFGDSVPFEFNKETNLFPIAGLATAELNRLGKTSAELKADKDLEKAGFDPIKPVTQRHNRHLLDLIAEDAGVSVNDIIELEIVLFDTQPACFGGLNDEFIYSTRLDNLGMTYAAVEGLIKSVESDSALDDESTVRLIACFDNEEIGSRSAQGADSDLLPSVIRRISKLPIGGEQAHASDSYELTLAKSFVISADMAHSVNPNYSSKHEQEHKPHMNEGTVVKVNANVRYATTSPGIALLQEVARRAKSTGWQPPDAKNETGSGVPLQLFVVRNDGRCGSTVGPFLSSLLGVRTVDVGNPQLSMHSIRETCGTYDVEHAVNLFDAFFEHYGELGDKVLVDGAQ